MSLSRTAFTGFASALLPRPAFRASAPAAAASGTAWQLAGGQAMSLRATRNSVLRVRQGRVWVTRDASRPHESEDLVLQSGQCLHVARGGRIVLEPWAPAGAAGSWDTARA